MTLPASGAISASDINVELGVASTAQLTFNDSGFRNLAGVGSGAIDLLTMRGKTRYIASNAGPYGSNGSLTLPATAGPIITAVLIGGGGGGGGGTDRTRNTGNYGGGGGGGAGEVRYITFARPASGNLSWTIGGGGGGGSTRDGGYSGGSAGGGGGYTYLYVDGSNICYAGSGGGGAVSQQSDVSGGGTNTGSGGTQLATASGYYGAANYVSGNPYTYGGGYGASGWNFYTGIGDSGYYYSNGTIGYGGVGNSLGGRDCSAPQRAPATGGGYGAGGGGGGRDNEYCGNSYPNNAGTSGSAGAIYFRWGW